jgi:hypothetical protein
VHGVAEEEEARVGLELAGGFECAGSAQGQRAVPGSKGAGKCAGGENLVLRREGQGGGIAFGGASLGAEAFGGEGAGEGGERRLVLDVCGGRVEREDERPRQERCGERPTCWDSSALLRLQARPS